MLSMLASDI